jgi:phosphotransferase system IIB component
MVSFHPLKRNSSTIQLSVLIAHEENVAKTPNRHLFASTISQSKAHCQAIVGPFAVITTSSMHATESEFN